jgi:hypothetical protein
VTAQECARVCCNTSACGGFTWDPRQADKTGLPACPQGQACCWLKQHGTVLHSGAARFVSGIRGQQGGPDGRSNVFTTTLQYFFGDDMIVAPIIRPVNKSTGLVSQSMWVPPGYWVLWQTGLTVEGPRMLTVQAKTVDIPVLVQAGAVLPLKTMASVSDMAPDPLVLQVLGCGDSGSGVCEGAGSVYEDDGVSLGYKKGAYRLMRVTHNSSATATAVTIVPHAGGSGYHGERTRRTFQLQMLVGGAQTTPPAAVTLNGKPVHKLLAPPSGAGARVQGWWHGNATGPFEGTVLVVGTGELSTEDVVSVLVQR